MELNLLERTRHPLQVIAKILMDSRYRAFWKYHREVSKILKYNHDFLFHYKHSILNEIIEFQNDAYDYYINMVKTFENSPFKDDYFSRFCLPNYIAYVLFPISYSLYPALLTAYLPHCYSSLRLTVEALGIMYLAEDIPDNWYERKLRRFRRMIRGRATSEVISKVDPTLGSLFSKFSDWLHAVNYLKRVTEYFFKSHELPPRSLGSPMPYKEADLEELDQLENDINAVRRLVPQILRKWYYKIGLQP